MNFGGRIMQLSWRIFGILKKEIVQALYLIPKWRFSSLGKNQTKDVCPKCLMMGKMSSQCLSEEQVCWASLSPVRWGCAAPGWQWGSWGLWWGSQEALLAQTWNLICLLPNQCVLHPPEFIHSKFQQQKKYCTGASEEKQLMGNYCDEGTLQGQFKESKSAFRHWKEKYLLFQS